MNANEKLEKILYNLYLKSGADVPAECAKTAVEYMEGRAVSVPDIQVKVVKGGTYKIKSYYLENNELMDIRGASTMITLVQDKAVPELLKAKLGYDSVVYNGGGNLFALVPADTDESLVNELEELAQGLLVTANSAYYISEPMPLSKILGKQYRDTMAYIESELEQRKKAKVLFDTSPESEWIGRKLLDKPVDADTLSENSKEYCVKCRKRIARYSRKGKKICGGCLHKVVAGEEQRSQYVSEFNKRTANKVTPPSTVSHIDKNDIAVIYADGNNMGGIIQTITNISEMIDFSAFVKQQMSILVYDSLSECDMLKFEIVAMGGDDLFLIVPAKKSLYLASKLIKKYQKAFADKFPGTDSTLSVGICIAKPNTPIKVVLEAAEDELSKAKKLVRENGGKGSVSFNVLQSYEGTVSDKGNGTLNPYSVTALDQILDFSEKVYAKQDMKTRLQNLLTAYIESDVKEETELYFSYINAKTDDRKKRIKLPEIDGYNLDGTFYVRNGNFETGISAFIWKDLLRVIKFGKGGV